MKRYIVGLVGALIVFVGIFVVVGLFVSLLPNFLRPVIYIGDFSTNNIIGVILGVAGAASSFMASVMRRR